MRLRVRPYDGAPSSSVACHTSPRRRINTGATTSQPTQLSSLRYSPSCATSLFSVRMLMPLSLTTGLLKTRTTENPPLSTPAALTSPASKTSRRRASAPDAESAQSASSPAIGCSSRWRGCSGPLMFMLALLMGLRG
ncbi:hypothetical protein BDW59DRAFT_145489 [Aspergillus cavernicola]|uniref:Uncharacterized protein n=1 Tax=Aspergillus cavernicola TaxID=176166 RepID=A0ABR4IEF0_9EURO